MNTPDPTYNALCGIIEGRQSPGLADLWRMPDRDFDVLVEHVGSEFSNWTVPSGRRLFLAATALGESSPCTGLDLGGELGLDELKANFEAALPSVAILDVNAQMRAMSRDFGRSRALSDACRVPFADLLQSLFGY